jgi:hypothetical protein
MDERTMPLCAGQVAVQSNDDDQRCSNGIIVNSRSECQDSTPAFYRLLNKNIDRCRSSTMIAHQRTGDNEQK